MAKASTLAARTLDGHISAIFSMENFWRNRVMHKSPSDGHCLLHSVIS